MKLTKPVIHQAIKADKKSLLLFYKSQRYSAKFMGGDTSYFIKNLTTDNIIASVIISKISPDHQQCFLHALVVDHHYQKQGLATALLKYVVPLHLPLVSFAKKNLSHLYQHAGMTLINTEQIDEKLSNELATRYYLYLKKQKNLTAFIGQNALTSDSINNRLP
jgi:hypothetical protein